MQLTEKLIPLLSPLIEEESAYLVDIEYVKEGSNWFLRVYCDTDNGITIEECVAISERIGDALDALDPDPFPDQYVLEVASPGAERPLKTKADIEKAIGKYVHLDYYVHQHGELFHEGYLRAVDDSNYALEIRDKSRTLEIEVPIEAVRFMRLAVEL